MSHPLVTIYGGALGSARSAGVELRGLKVLVQSRDESTNEAAAKLAEDLITMDSQLTFARREAAHAREVADRAQASDRASRDALGAVVAGTRRFFGPVLLRPGANGWGGEVWLLDPTKQDRGTGLRFGSLLILWINHPELRPIGTAADGILLDAIALPETVQAEVSQ